MRPYTLSRPSRSSLERREGRPRTMNGFLQGPPLPGGCPHRPRPRTGTGACPCGTPPRSVKQFLPSRSELIFIGRVNSSRIRAVEKPPRLLSALFGPFLLPGSERTLSHRDEGASARICLRGFSRRWGMLERPPVCLWFFRRCCPQESGRRPDEAREAQNTNNNSRKFR